MQKALIAVAIVLSAPARADELEPTCAIGDKPCLARLEAEAQRCPEVKLLRVARAEVQWRRCGPEEAEWGPDGEIIRPRSFLLVRAPGGQFGFSFGDPDREAPEFLETVEQVAGSWLFIEAFSSGTAREVSWTLLDLDATPPSRAFLPADLESRAGALLRGDETLCCRDWQVAVKQGQIWLASSVRRLTDPQSTARARIEAVLTLRGNALVLKRLRRR